MCIYSDNDIRNTIEKAKDILQPYILACHPDYKEQIKKILNDEKKSQYEIVTLPYLDKDKIYIFDKKYLNWPSRGNSKNSIQECHIAQLIEKGGDD